MITSWKIGHKKKQEQDVIDYLKKAKESFATFNILDVGGIPGNPLTDLSDCFINLGSSEDKRFVRGDINENDVWADLPRFSYSICSHTLEDIVNPKFVCDRLSDHSEAGYISVPTKHVEFIHNEKVHYTRGFFHHRWIFTIKNGELWGLPKLPFIENNHFQKRLDRMAYTPVNWDEKQNLMIFWEKEIKLNLIDDGVINSTFILKFLDLLENDDLD